MKTLFLNIICSFYFISLFAQQNLNDNIPVEINTPLSNATNKLLSENKYIEIKLSKNEINYQKELLEKKWKNTDSIKFCFKRYSYKQNKKKTHRPNCLLLYFADDILYKEYYDIFYSKNNFKECQNDYLQNINTLKELYLFWEENDVKDKTGTVIGKISKFCKTNDFDSIGENIIVSYQILPGTNLTKSENVEYCSLWFEKSNIGITRLHK